MLPLELLKVVFGALSRDDLDALMLASVLFRDIVLRDFVNGPFRHFDILYIDGYQNYGFRLPAGNKYWCRDNDVFSDRLRFGRPGRVW